MNKVSKFFSPCYFINKNSLVGNYLQVTPVAFKTLLYSDLLETKPLIHDLFPEGETMRKIEDDKDGKWTFDRENGTIVEEHTLS